MTSTPGSGFASTLDYLAVGANDPFTEVFTIELRRLAAFFKTKAGRSSDFGRPYGLLRS